MAQVRGRTVPIKDQGLEAKLQEAINKHNELTATLNEAQRQITLWSEERQRLTGQIMLLQELLKNDIAETA